VNLAGQPLPDLSAVHLAVSRLTTSSGQGSYRLRSWRPLEQSGSKESQDRIAPALFRQGRRGLQSYAKLRIFRAHAVRVHRDRGEGVPGEQGRYGCDCCCHGDPNGRSARGMTGRFRGDGL
jgi:hypothetical protein